ncbi:hypothetical protein PTSG_10172 [Salpingoeca rosetta]|uniref:Uncharacterized protein n=1 Tax=Salpingoeca rosetta (strain ATCC 50818 / BSB-021) TaxID=946362 RepID=F2UQI3_SALR5|nr:uncharacterized protein PTSG_10172 [Salpingoeca rosetta]EGD79888.1 hypothetical protein PTSG_10172 [Salpingoeca rosetta]|eukprot:XP_004988509.1 hypothetical protein PTSG_10172 [Salpingoeca rosetta]
MPQPRRRRAMGRAVIAAISVAVAVALLFGARVHFSGESSGSGSSASDSSGRRGDGRVQRPPVLSDASTTVLASSPEAEGDEGEEDAMDEQDAWERGWMEYDQKPVDVTPLEQLFKGVCAAASGHESPQPSLLNVAAEAVVAEHRAAFAGAALESSPSPSMPSPPLCNLPELEGVFTGHQRSSPRAIVDVVFFSHKLDLLQARLLQLRNVVTHHVVVESAVSVWGQAKPLMFESTLDLMDWPKNLKHITVPSCSQHANMVNAVSNMDPPLHADEWKVEQAYKDCAFNAAIKELVREMPDRDDDTLVLLSDSPTTFPDRITLEQLQWCELRPKWRRVDLVMDRTILGCLQANGIDTQCSIQRSAQAHVPALFLKDIAGRFDQTPFVDFDTPSQPASSTSIFGGTQLARTGTLPQFVFGTLVSARKQLLRVPSLPKLSSPCNTTREQLGIQAQDIASNPLWWQKAIQAAVVRAQLSADDTSAPALPPSPPLLSKHPQSKSLSQCGVPWPLMQNRELFSHAFCRPRRSAQPLNVA